jgi:hypothetical protein
VDHLNAFIAQAAILLLPGIIWARLDVRYAIKEKTSEFDFFIRAFVYGLASYAVTFAIYALVRRPFALIDVTAADNRNIITRQVGGEIIVATAVGFCLAILWIYAANWKLLTRFLHAIRATRRYGDDDVWDFTFNSTATASRFVNVRDFDKKIVYAGWVNAFSETDKLRELTLYDVKVYDFAGVLLYDVPHLYIARKPDDIHIEFPLA